MPRRAGVLSAVSDIGTVLCDPVEYHAQPAEIWTDDIEHVRLQNDLQLRHATRFVFSKSGDFSLANQVLDVYPQVGYPNRKRTRS